MTKAEKKLLTDRLWLQVEYAKKMRDESPEKAEWYSGMRRGLSDAINIIDNDFHKKREG